MAEKIAVLSDIHGNSPALEAVLEDIHQNKCERILVLGDIVNGIDPAGSAALLRQVSEVECIKGNAEHYILTRDIEAFPDRDNPFYRELITLIRWWKNHLSEADLNWMDMMPELMLRDRVCLVHDSPLDRIFPDRRRIRGVADKYQELCYHATGITRSALESEPEDLTAFMRSRDVSYLFCGHTHIPFLERCGDRTICNTGSVGMPLDGDPRSSWVLFEYAGKTEDCITIKRTPYDMDKVLDLINEVDFLQFTHFARKEAYKKMLTTGIPWQPLRS